MDYRTLYAKTVAALRLLAKQNGVKLPAGASKMTIVQRILEKEHGYAEAAVDQLIQEETAGAEEPRAREPEKEETKAEPVSKLQDTEKSENIENSKAVLKMEKPLVSEEAVSENIPVIEKKEENPVPEKMEEAPVKRPRGRPRKTDAQRAAEAEAKRVRTEASSNPEKKKIDKAENAAAEKTPRSAGGRRGPGRKKNVEAPIENTNASLEKSASTEPETTSVSEEAKKAVSEPTKKSKSAESVRIDAPEKTESVDVSEKAEKAASETGWRMVRTRRSLRPARRKKKRTRAKKSRVRLLLRRRTIDLVSSRGIRIIRTGSIRTIRTRTGSIKIIHIKMASTRTARISHARTRGRLGVRTVRRLCGTGICVRRETRSVLNMCVPRRMDRRSRVARLSRAAKTRRRFRREGYTPAARARCRIGRL